jgi:hypothetical protein
MQRAPDMSMALAHSRFVVLVCLAACSAGADDAASNEQASTEATPSTLSLDVVTQVPTLASATLGPSGIVPDAVDVGALVEHYTAAESRAALRVVCTRFEPCARSVADPANTCIGQVRFVLQPVLRDETGAPYAQDAAVHVFYELPRDAMHAVARKLAALPSAHEQRALAPVDRDPRVSLDAVAAGRAVRVTFVRNVDVKGNTWDFGGFDLGSGAIVPLVVPRTSATEQRIVVNGSWPYGISISPRPSTEPDLGALLDPTRLGILADSSPDVAAARVSSGYAAALSIEDPTQHDASNVDCASCHVAGAARRVAIESRLAELAPPAPVVRGVPLDALANGKGQAEILRACGYAGKTAVVSQRTVNESALAAVRMGELGDER